MIILMSPLNVRNLCKTHAYRSLQHHLRKPIDTTPAKHCIALHDAPWPCHLAKYLVVQLVRLVCDFEPLILHWTAAEGCQCTTVMLYSTAHAAQHMHMYISLHHLSHAA